MRVKGMVLATACVVALLSVCAAAFAPAPEADQEAFVAMAEWVAARGGMSKVQIGVDEKGMRGLYTSTAVAQGDLLYSVPETCILNTGSASGNILHSILTLLREQVAPAGCSRFQPYLATLPAPSSATNLCIIPVERIKLLQSAFWESHVELWQGFLYAAWEERRTQQLDYTFQDMLGDVDVTYGNVMGACALVTTRYVLNARGRLVLAPFFDLANHHPHCPHRLQVTQDGGMLHLAAGKDMQEGEEVCHFYGSELRDDYALFYYGFLPQLNDPPRLLAVDHHTFANTEESLSVPDVEFSGNTDETKAEIERLSAILAELGEIPSHEPAVGEPAYDSMLELRARRVNALTYEIGRLQGLLDKEL